MIAEIAWIVVLVLGTAICLLSVWGMAAPGRLRQLIRWVTDQPSGIYFAAIVRVLLGAVLIVAAPDSRFPLAFEAIGWLAIVAAVGILLMGRDRMRRLVAWFDRFSDMAMRAWLILGVAFGAFLIYGITEPSSVPGL